MSTDIEISAKVFQQDSEMALLMRNFNWADHRLGPIESWPRELSVVLNMMLDSQFPMFLYWGPEYTSFYNDAFREKLGEEKHPIALGAPAYKVWPEVWGGIKEVIDLVTDSGRPVFKEDHYTQILRNKKLEETYWTYCYSGIRDEYGKIAGILSICMETTEKVHAARTARQSEDNLRNLMAQAPIGLLIVKGPEMTIDFANDQYLRIVDGDPSWIGKVVWDCLPDLREQGYEEILLNVFKSGVAFESVERPVSIRKKGLLFTGYFTFSYQAMKNHNGEITSVMVIVLDVTEQVQARQRVEGSEEKLKQALEVSKLGTFDFDLTTNRLETSERFNYIWGHVSNTDHGTLIKAIHPEDVSIRERAHRIAYSTGHLSYEARIYWKTGKLRWIRAEGKVFYDSARIPIRMIGTVADITEEREVKDRLEKTANSLDLALKAGRLGSYEYDVNSGRIECNEQCKANFGLLKDDPLNFDRFMSLVVPEDRKGVLTAIESAFKSNIAYEAEYRVRWLDGTVHMIKASGLPVFDKKGRPHQLIGVTSEISVKKLSLN
jgi:PAS domain S-box-containing protein